LNSRLEKVTMAKIPARVATHLSLAPIHAVGKLHREASQELGMNIDLAPASWFGRERAVGYAKMMAIAFVPTMVWYYLQATGPVGSDFMGLWSAGRLTLAGHPANVYVPAAEAAFQAQFGRDHWVQFLCSPPFLFLIAPFALLPYAIALPTWVAATYAAWLVVARRLIPGGFWPIAVFPGAVVSAWHAQNGLVTGGLFVAATLQLRQRPWLAGVLFGALIVKPQLALLVPVALIAGRQWKAVFGAAASSAALLLVSAIVFGPETIMSFIASSAQGRHYLAAPTVAAFQRMPTIYADAALAFGPHLATWAQAGATLVVAILVAWVWSRPVDLLAKCAVLALATPLATPYLFPYDLVLLIVPVCWLAREGLEHGFRRWDRPVLAAFYWAPMLTRAFCVQTGADLMPLVLVGFLGFALPRIVAPATSAPVRLAA
jgi:hypothetical protein